MADLNLSISIPEAEKANFIDIFRTALHEVDESATDQQVVDVLENLMGLEMKKRYRSAKIAIGHAAVEADAGAVDEQW